MLDCVTEQSKARNALAYIDATENAQWLKVSLCLANEFGASGESMFDDWSQAAPNYDAQAVRQAYRSALQEVAKGACKVTIGSLYHMAQGAGYKAQAMSPDERRQIESDRAQREAARKSKHAQAKEKETRRQAAAQIIALRKWESAVYCDEHPYSTRKGVSPNGLRHHKGMLLIPMMNDVGEVANIQSISADGEKAFEPLPMKGLFHLIECPAQGVPLIICEGWATGASLSQSTGFDVAVAFNAGNLTEVAQFMRTRFPQRQIVICADDDHEKTHAGIKAANKAAQAIGGLVAIPNFLEPMGKTDFNDMHQEQGLEAVAVAVSQAVSPNEIQNMGQSGNVMLDKVLPTKLAPCFELRDNGVYFIAHDKEGKELEPTFVCSPLHVLAETRNHKSGEWGKLLQWQDSDGLTHQWAMPARLIQDDGKDVRIELANRGLRIGTTRVAREKLLCYIQTCLTSARARCVQRLGWYGGVYVTPSEAIGNSDELVVFQSESDIQPELSTAGSAQDWRDKVAILAAGNSRAVFAVSVAFAGPLAEIAGEDSGGFHLRGASSCGKSTALKLAASVWGCPSRYPRLWRATANGLEGLATLHNDGLLILDELSQMDAREAGEAAYLLANGQGKTRASRNGAARQSAKWKTLFLSAGEESLTALMAKAGKTANAGQEIRLADIPADAGLGMGTFEFIHGFDKPEAFARALNDACSQHYGAVGMDWLRLLVRDRQELHQSIKDSIAGFINHNVPEGADGQASRVAKRFALVAAAGELATLYGLTGWAVGEAEDAASACYLAWLDAFGGEGRREDRALLSQVKGFFEQHGSSRFEDFDAAEFVRTTNRAGFVDKRFGQEWCFYVLPEVFKKEICKGFDHKSAEITLIREGWIKPGEGNRPTRKPRIPKRGTPRCYEFTAKMWDAEL